MEKKDTRFLTARRRKGKDRIPQDKWFQQKAQQHYLSTLKEEEEDNSSIESETVSQRSNQSRGSSRSQSEWSRLHVNAACVQQG